MIIIYWAHSYRKEDAAVNNHFGILIEKAARFIVNWDPPSKDVNQAKLEQNLRTCDGMVAVLTWRSTGPSQYILYEIGLALRARKPLLVFVDDRIPGDFVPAQILQRRFSHRTYFRQARDHAYALHQLKTYMGDQPAPRYQPSFGQRTCGFVGLRALKPATRTLLHEFAHEKGYATVDLERVHWDNPLVYEPFEHLACLDVCVSCADSRAIQSRQWIGALNTVAVPSISFTTNAKFGFSDKFPREFQPRQAETEGAPPVREVLEKEFNLYEEDFLKTEDPGVIERYTRMQLEAGFLAGHYEANTRSQFTEVIMGDQYKVEGQAGAVGPQAHAHDITFTQLWNQHQQQLDLPQLAEQLKTLHKAMESQATEPAHKLAVGAVAAAEQSARENNGPKVMEYLKTAGNWGIGVAEKISADLAKEAIKGAIGL